VRRFVCVARILIENLVDINKLPADVFDYASDHTNEPEWNPKMRSVRKLTDGPIGHGTRYEMEFVPGRPMVATCVCFDPPHAWELAGDTLGVHVSMSFEVAPTTSGSRLALRTVFSAGGLLALTLPLLRRRLGPDFQRAAERIKVILEAAPS
jgi:uncharacterized protein YndB with AHSA1/START domain